MKDDAVSPVVGVMLMLTVTVIIAAVVAATASGFASDGIPDTRLGPAEIVYAGQSDNNCLFQMNSGSPIETALIYAAFNNTTNAVVKVTSGITSTGGKSLTIGERLIVPYELPSETVRYELYNAETGLLIASGEIIKN